MKVYRLEFVDSGVYEVLNEKELKEQYTQDEIENFTNNEMIIFYEIPFTTRQLTNAKKKHNNEEFRDWYEDEFMETPSLLDVLQYLYS